jgi:NAD(P)-dependent dehydrogenase (short-subunit alcohol dehydrogenase family)
MTDTAAAPASGEPRTVAVTGASRGLGAAMVLELARRGLTVGCLSRKGIGPEDNAVPADIEPRLVGIACDIDDPASVRAALAELTARTGACTPW